MRTHPGVGGLTRRPGRLVRTGLVTATVTAFVALTVMVASGQASASKAVPTVSAVSPGAGPLAGGTSVTVTGTAFTNVTSVSFGGTKAASYKVVSSTSITATSPALPAGTVDVGVTTTGGTSVPAAGDRFTYVAGPTVTGLAPASGAVTGGNTVTLTGSGFTGATLVSFGSATTTNFTVVSDSEITTFAPAGSAGSATVSVSTPGGASTASPQSQFTYLTGTNPGYAVSGNKVIGPGGKAFVPYGSILPCLAYVPLTGNAAQNACPGGTNAYNDQSITALGAAWHTDDVRIQVAEEDLFDQSPYDAAYLAQLDSEVQLANSLGMVVTITQQEELATNGAEFPDGNSVTFWNLLASHYQNNPMVFFDLFNEPRLAQQALASKQNMWNVWRNGGTVDDLSSSECTTNGDCVDDTFVGDQTLVNDIRNDGATNLIIAEGPDFDGSLAQIPAYVLTGANVAYGIEPNLTGQAINPAGWYSLYGRVAATYPVFGESMLAYLAAQQCKAFDPTLIPLQFQYMQSIGMGTLVWGMTPGDLVTAASQSTPTTYAGLSQAPCTYPVGKQSSNTVGPGAEVLAFFQSEATGTPLTNPSISSVSPAVNGSVTIQGTHLTSGSDVTFGAADSPGITVASDNQLTASVPAGGEGTSVSVLTTAGSTSTALPGAPTSVTATPGAGQATVVFTPPSSTGASGAMSYSVTATDSSNPGNGGQTATATASPITVKGLTNGDSYTFAVTATSGTDAGGASPSSAAVVPTSVPDAPTGVTAAAGAGQASVSFAAPFDEGSSITSYTVTAVDSTTPGNGGQVVTGSASPLTVSGLTNGDSYTFTVTAANGPGPGPSSPASGAVVPASVPDAPSGVTATAGAGQASVSFAAPFDEGSSITSYTVTAVDLTTPGNGGQVVTGSASPLTVSGLTNGDSYTFTVTAANGPGPGPSSPASGAVVPASVPDAPSGVTATAGAGQASVSFAAPFDEGSSINSYTVTAVDSTTPGNGGQVVTGSASPLTVSGLTNGDSYTFTVTAANGPGPGPSSPASGAVVPATVPDAPTGVTAAAGAGQASVSFAAPFDEGSSITSYTVSAVDSTTPGNGGQVVTGSASPLTVSGLTNGDSYTFNVTAVNAIGSGPPSDPTSAVVPATAPDAPSAATATFGDSQATISFTPPFDEGAAITSYSVTASDSTDPDGGGEIASGSGSPITVSGLSNGDQYSFTVTASNAIGAGPASSPSAAVVPATVPDAPTGVSATSGDAEAWVEFTPSFDEGSAITSYTVTATDSTTPGNGGQTVSGPESPLTLQGLTNGDSYTFAVTATNDVGAGPTSPASGSVVPATVPDAPTEVSGTAGDDSAAISFAPPDTDGGSAIESYTVTATDSTHPARGGEWATRASSPITVGGLANGDDYTFTVTANNAVGTGSLSAPTDAVVPYAVPDAASVDTVTAGNSQALVAFSPPFDEGSPVISYTVVASDSTDPSNGGQTVTGRQSPLTVTGLTNGDTYTVTVTATNRRGAGSTSPPSGSVVPATTPDAPDGVTATPGDQQAAIAFDAPFDEGSAITSYTVLASDSTTPGNGGETATGTGSPISVSGLTNGDSYTFTVTATNAVGDGQTSAASGSVVPATTPDAPDGVTATPGDEQAAVAFDAPFDEGSAISSYTVLASDSTTPGNGGEIATGTGSPISVSGLTNGDSYTFTVTATNAVGDGQTSAASGSVVPATTPDAPVMDSVTGGDASAAVTFSPPGSDGGSAVTSYTLTAVDSTTPGNGGQTATAANSPVTVSGLTNGDSYTFTVTATNAVGDGQTSAASGSVVPATTPDAPVMDSVTGGDASAAVTFSPPGSDGGSAVTSYTVTAVDSTTPGNGGQTATAANSPVTVSGLTNGDSYTFTVTAGNSLGDGPASDASGAVTPVTVPGAPVIGEVAGGDASATVTFSPPGSDGGSAVTSYTVTAADSTDAARGGQTEVGATSPITVGGLTDGDSYTFTVTAGNAVGNGPVSAASSPIAPAAAPGPPVIGTVTAGNARAIVAFKAPSSNGGSPVTSYTVTAKDATTAARGGETSAGTKSPITVSGLTNGDRYTFTVTATNGVGTGPASAASGAVAPATLPGAPSMGTVTAGTGSAQVSFTAPSSNGGSAVASYTVTATDLIAAGRGGQTAVGSSSPIAVGGLTNGDRYTLKVTATNAVGTGAASAASAAVVPATVPGSPVIGAVTAGNGTATVAFSAPSSSGGSAVTSYTVTATDETNLASGSETTTATRSPITVTGLTDGDIYVFTVAASNAVGTGPPSGPSGAAVPHPPLAVSSALPGSLAAGATNVGIVVQGSAFTQTATLAVSGSGVTVSNLTVVNSTTIDADITVAASVAPGALNLTATDSYGSATCNRCITVDAPPSVSSASPTVVALAATHAVTVTGSGFEAGARLAVTSSSWPLGVSVTKVTSTTISAAVSVQANAPIGSYTVTVTNPDAGSSACSSCFSTVAAPTFTGLSPSSGVPGRTTTVTLTGTGFAAGPAITGPSGVTFSKLSVKSPTTVTATITVAAGTPSGQNLPVTVTNAAAGGYGTVTGDLLTVT